MFQEGKNLVLRRLQLRDWAIIILFFCVVPGPGAIASGHTEEMHDHMHSMNSPDVGVKIRTTPRALKAGSPAEIFFIMRDSRGKPLRGLTVMHERLVHVVIASADFSVFAHIHPEDFGPITEEMKRKEEYPVRFTFPKAGKYVIAADSALKGEQFSSHFIVDVSGEPVMGLAERDLAHEKKFDNLRVTLSSEPREIVAGKETVLKYMIRKGGTPVQDLEAYLAAPMHVAIISTDLHVFIHAHGEIPGSPGGRHHGGHGMHMRVPAKFGPELDVPVVFPAKGLYQIFSETKYKGKVYLMSFMVSVK
jgi:Cu+-exporting ATPase